MALPCIILQEKLKGPFGFFLKKKHKNYFSKRDMTICWKMDFFPKIFFVTKKFFGKKSILPPVL